MIEPGPVIVEHILERDPFLMVWEVRSWTSVINILVVTGANAVFDVSTAPTRCASLEGMLVGDVCMVPVHGMPTGMLRRGFVLCRDGRR